MKEHETNGTHSVAEKSPSLLILGLGYVGSAVAKKFPLSTSTKRNTFELSRRETWHEALADLPSKTQVLWTFPAATHENEETLALEFYDSYLKNHRVIIYGTISSYLVKQDDEWITEESELNMQDVRTRTEEALRKKGACILHLAGIFGPDRDPENWYQKGYIQHGLSFLNLIHLDDIISVTKKLYDYHSAFGQRFNLSNGAPKTHFEIVEKLKMMNRLPSEFEIPLARKTGSKRVRNEKLKQLLSLRDNDFTEYP